MVNQYLLGTLILGIVLYLIACVEYTRTKRWSEPRIQAPMWVIGTMLLTWLAIMIYQMYFQIPTPPLFLPEK